MSKFHTPPPLPHKDSPRKGYSLLLAKLGYDSDIAGITIEAEVGFETNFVTGRKLLVVRLIVTDSMNRAAVIHDLLYGKDSPVSREMADEVFYEAMLVDDVRKWRAKMAYSCVRACGWLFYKGSK